MYVDSCKSGKYSRHLLRESFRLEGKVCHRTIANLSHCSEAEIKAIKLALKHKHNLSELGPLSSSVSLHQGLSVGAVSVVFAIAQRLGLDAVLGSTPQGKLALWQVVARVIDQGSRLSAVRLAGSHAACAVLDLPPFNEDTLYANLDWLSQQQAEIEDRLLKKAYPRTKPELYLYDVTSSYLEGCCNEYAAFGYNRDGKRGKRQIVIGLLCDQAGRPLSIEVFPGNTTDVQTFGAQVKKVAERFGGKEVTFVGDRGLLRSKQLAELKELGFHYITGLTKPQIEALLRQGAIQMSLFDQDLAEVETTAGERYLLRRNPERALDQEQTRKEKLATLREWVKKWNKYLQEHARADERKALAKGQAKQLRLKLQGWTQLEAHGRVLVLTEDAEALREDQKLDGCYVLRTDLKRTAATKETVLARYKDLALVEWAFRTSKTVQLEMRPLYVRKGSRTRGHALVVMLAYLIVRELAGCWAQLNQTVEEGLDELSSLTLMEMRVEGKPQLHCIPEPRESVAKLLEAAKVVLPKTLPISNVKVSTRKNLAERRKSK
jgi:transposase